MSILGARVQRSRSSLLADKRGIGFELNEPSHDVVVASVASVVEWRNTGGGLGDVDVGFSFNQNIHRVDVARIACCPKCSAASTRLSIDITLQRPRKLSEDAR